MANILPISSLEFATMLLRTKPPPGWSETLAVANSGGPDSTCLLFLLSRYLREFQQEETDIPSSRSLRRIVSLSIDHDLQESSQTMAKHASSIAKSLGVEHITTKLPWGQGMCPRKPGPGEKFEQKARDMRQMILFEHLKSLGANALASGHHADDQVETMLMRLGRGSGQFGLSGMRLCRRWGMGTGKEGSDAIYAIEGMRKWMIRPLLEVSKDRILATCEENKLDYVTDLTNFQPQLTIRNAIRHILKYGGSRGMTPEDPSFAELPRTLAQQTAAINMAASKHVTDFNLGSHISQLRKVNNDIACANVNIDDTVDHLIAKYRIPSPPGTFMITPWSLKAIESRPVREALLLRITRYVSPEPWGSPRSELGRRETSLNRLSTYLCDDEAFSSRNNNSLCVGSQVWWKLVSVVDKRLRNSTNGLDRDKIAWLALRQPQQRSNVNHELKANGLNSDVTSELIQREHAWPVQEMSPNLDFLFDKRFLIRFSVDLIPQEVAESLSLGGRIFVEPTEPWTLPQIIHLHAGTSTTIHTHITPQPSFHLRETDGNRKHKVIKSNWITVEYYRPLSSI